MKDFYKAEKLRQSALIASGFFDGDIAENPDRPHVLIQAHGASNIYPPIREEALDYFRQNRISWWSGRFPTGNVLSSQVACINHLMPLRCNSEAVLAMVNGIRNIFRAVLPLRCDRDESYIAFEAVSRHDLMNEKRPSRGARCTSVDALVLAEDFNGERWLIPIEWKYTEFYYSSDCCDKSNEGITYRVNQDHTVMPKGQVRLDRYSKLISNSRQIKKIPEFIKGNTYPFQGSVFFYEPFYQLMRQTLWAEQMTAPANRERELIQAQHYLHVHAVPEGNSALRTHMFPVSQKNMEATWRACLHDKSKYVIVDPRDLLFPVKDMMPDEWWNYLNTRYFLK